MSRKVFRLKARNEKRFEILLNIASAESFEREFLLILLCRPEEVIIFPPSSYSLSCEQHFAPFLFLRSVLYRIHRNKTYGEATGRLVEICLLFGRVLTTIKANLGSAFLALAREKKMEKKMEKKIKLWQLVSWL